MKEVTYEDWQKNPTPRMMWVWDSTENNKEQRKVLYIIDKPITYQVIALIKSELSTESFMHCAEVDCKSIYVEVLDKNDVTSAEIILNALRGGVK